MTIRVACLGTGYFSRFHRGSWARISAVHLVGVCDIDLTKAQATGLPAFGDLDRLLSETQPDLLDIIVPPSAQAGAIRKALDHGVRWLVCQKPFCRDVHEARAIAAEAHAKGATLVVHENFRFQPWYRAIKAELDDNRLGSVHQMTFRLRPGDGQGANAYLDRQPYFQTMERFLVHETAVHWIDTFRFLFGDPVAVYADLRRVNPVIAGEDAGVILFDHAHGVRTLFDGNRSLDHSADNHRRTMGEALVEGTEGSLTLTGDGTVTFRAFGSTDQTVVCPPDSGEGFGGDCVHHLQSHVIQAMQNGTSVENDAESYLRVLDIEAAVYRSAEEGRKLSLSQG